jgi:hypothetical protein
VFSHRVNLLVSLRGSQRCSPHPSQPYAPLRVVPLACPARLRLSSQPRPPQLTAETRIRHRIIPRRGQVLIWIMSTTRRT